MKTLRQLSDEELFDLWNAAMYRWKTGEIDAQDCYLCGKYPCSRCPASDGDIRGYATGLCSSYCTSYSPKRYAYRLMRSCEAEMKTR